MYPRASEARAIKGLRQIGPGKNPNSEIGRGELATPKARSGSRHAGGQVSDPAAPAARSSAPFLAARDEGGGRGLRPSREYAAAALARAEKIPRP